VPSGKLNKSLHSAAKTIDKADLPASSVRRATLHQLRREVRLLLDGLSPPSAERIL
jgi:hypothetical protein